MQAHPAKNSAQNPAPAQPNNIFTVTFHYADGQSDAFHVDLSSTRTGSTPQDASAAIRHLLDRSWWAFQLGDQTVIIRMENVTRVEIVPPALNFQGEGVFGRASRVTALTRGGARR